MGLIFYARGDSSTANNSSINSQGTSTTPTTELVFETFGPSGDYSLDFNNGESDPDTMLYIDGVARFFTVEFSGFLPSSNKFSNVNGQDLRGEEVVVITDDLTGQRYFFLTDPTLNTFATMDSVPNGAIPITGVNSSTDVVICFARGTRIDTPAGPKRIENLVAGDMVWTPDGPQPILWIGSTRLSYVHLAADPSNRPVRIRAGTFGRNVPRRDVVLSPNHRVVVSGGNLPLFLGIDRGMCAAKHLVDGKNVQYLLPAAGVEYFHVMMETHAVLRSDNLLSESLYLGAAGRDAVGPEAHADLVRRFPGVQSPDDTRTQSVLPILRKHEATLLLRANGLRAGGINLASAA